MPVPRRPTFLSIGAQKCGTTWLAQAVAQHPQVATGKRKELHFFSQRAAYEQGLASYEEQFRRKPVDARAVGEFTPNYWWTVGSEVTFHLQGSADRIADAYPDLQLLVCLRDPVDRAVSAYFHHMRAGRYPPHTSISEAIERYPDIVEFGWYATQFEAWLERFPRERFLVLVYEDDIGPDDAKPGTLRRVFEHIGVDPGFSPDDLEARRNVRGTDFDIRLRHAGPVRRRLMTALPDGAREWKRWAITVGEAERADLRAGFTPEIERLEAIVGRSLPWRRATRLDG